jgi:hypothetical protein
MEIMIKITVLNIRTVLLILDVILDPDFFFIPDQTATKKEEGKTRN